MKKLLLTTLLALLPAKIYANHKIAYVIHDIAPHVDEKTALDYAIIIDKYSQQYKVSWKVVVAICKQESDLVHGEIDDLYRDFGICQMNWRTIKHRELDLGLLLTDVDYAFKETIEMLAELKKKYYTGSKGHWQWFTRYHSFTPFFRKRYWFGSKKSGHDGLKYKLDMIERSLERGREKIKTTDIPKRLRPASQASEDQLY